MLYVRREDDDKANDRFFKKNLFFKLYKLITSHFIQYTKKHYS